MKAFALTGEERQQSRIRAAQKAVICAGIRLYLKVVEKTGRVIIEGEEGLGPDVMAGYWHGDGTGMYLVLAKLVKRLPDIAVIVTADERGDFIEDVLKHYGARALRMPDGLRMRKRFPELMKEAKQPGRVIATALDGPLGPLYEPKKLLFLLAKEADKEVWHFKLSYSAAIRSRGRWDHHAYPLPFSTIRVKAERIGRVDSGKLKNFEEYKKRFTPPSRTLRGLSEGSSNDN